MRRASAIASALVVLVGGVAATGSGDVDITGAATAATTAATSTAPAGGAGEATATATVQKLKVDLAAVVVDMREEPYGHGQARIAALNERLQSISAGIAALEAHADASDAPSASAIFYLRGVEDELSQYVADGEAGDEMAMQLTVFRYLWALNRLPDSLSDLYGA